jgi:hypothetical protein
VTAPDTSNSNSDTAAAGLTQEEMAAEGASELPDRQAMSLLDVNANLDLALDLAAPVNAAVAANANAAVPIDAAVSANVLSPDAASLASADQDSLISQSLDGEATAISDQTAAVDQA